MRAIDLYSGVGGWTLGLKMAGIEVVASYEWWQEANHTHSLNFRSTPKALDIRSLNLEELPKDIDIVVGSPPCTQFSFANRGGNGDLVDGLRDIEKFLEIVAYLSPRYWAMENVPRVAAILEEELGLHGRLARFRGLIKVIEIINMSEFGLPQSRKRMIAGDFPIELLLSYRAETNALCLGDVIEKLKASPAIDPVYGFELPRESLTDHIYEAPLDDEDMRMNRDSKQFHPFYNVMSFPDPLDRPARTVTATCTRVSRESIVVDDGGLRRLTVRERASLQGFPLTFQFYGKSFSSRLKLVGNAVPPLMTYYIGQAMRHVPPKDSRPCASVAKVHPMPVELPAEVKPDTKKRRFPRDRRFRAAIPNLRFGSGVRFDLANGAPLPQDWEVRFYFGTSKRTESLKLDDQLLRRMRRHSIFNSSWLSIQKEFNGISEQLTGLTPGSLQSTWNGSQDGLSPFALVDALGAAVGNIMQRHDWDSEAVTRFVLKELGVDSRQASSRKLKTYASQIAIGFIVGSWTNSYLRSLDKRIESAAVS